MRSDDAAIDRLIEQLKSGGRNPPPDLPPDWGSGTPNGMEARVAKLEAHVEHIRAELAKFAPVPTDLAVLCTRVDALPTKGFIVTSALTTITAVVGVLTVLSKIGFLAP